MRPQRHKETPCPRCCNSLPDKYRKDSSSPSTHAHCLARPTAHAARAESPPKPLKALAKIISQPTPRSPRSPVAPSLKQHPPHQPLPTTCLAPIQSARGLPASKLTSWHPSISWHPALLPGSRTDRRRTCWRSTWWRGPCHVFDRLLSTPPMGDVASTVGLLRSQRLVTANCGSNCVPLPKRVCP